MLYKTKSLCDELIILFWVEVELLVEHGTVLLRVPVILLFIILFTELGFITSIQTVLLQIHRNSKLDPLAEPSESKIGYLLQLIFVILVIFVRVERYFGAELIFTFTRCTLVKIDEEHGCRIGVESAKICEVTEIPHDWEDSFRMC